MRNLYVHCGLPKTGTTSIQRYFSSQRRVLREDGIEYPKIGLNSSEIAHHKLSEQITDRSGFDITKGPVGHLLRYLRNPNRQDKIVLSSEGFSNCLYAERARERFLNFLRAASEANDGVYVVFRIRPFSEYFDSWYIQRLKSGSVPANIDEYAEGSKRWLKRYFSGLKALKDTIGVDHIMMIDAQEGGGDAVTALLSRVGGVRRVPESEEDRYNSRLGLKKAALILQLQELAGAEDARAQQELVALRSAIVKLSEIPNDLYRYRVISFPEANRIQSTANRSALPFIRPLVTNSIRPEQEFYDEVSLADTTLTPEDRDFLDVALPAEVRASELFGLWRKSPASPGKGKKIRAKWHHAEKRAPSRADSGDADPSFAASHSA